MPDVVKPTYQVIGTRPIRHDGVDKVTGRAKYGADLRLAGQIVGVIVRSPHAHARILSIDTSAAEQFPGVRAIATAKDLPHQGDRVVELGEGAVNMRHLSANVLAQDKVLYKGHAVAGIAADNIHIALEAAKLIKIEYEPLPVVLSVDSAMAPDAPILNDDVRTEPVGKAEAIKDSAPTNIAKSILFECGSIADGFAQSEIIIEREYHLATVHQGYIEPHNATVLWNSDNKLTVWLSTQGAFSARQQTAELLRLPVSDVKVVPMEIGGGFGGKISVYLPPVAAILSRKSGRPVQIVMDRAAVFEATGPTPGGTIRVKLGADKSGKLTAAQAWMAYEAGAYPGSPIAAGCMCIFACYNIPNARVEGYDVCVNKPRTNAYRAPGSTQAAFAVETALDEIASQLKIDPLEIRQKNAAAEGTRRVDGPVYARIGMQETVAAIQASEHYQTPLSGPHQGRGIASGFWFNAGLKSSVTATVSSDGHVSLIEGSSDIGGSRTGIAMQLAETLGIPVSIVHPAVVDTDSVGYTDVTGGSRTTFATGIAAIEAAKDIQRQMLARAAELWDVPLDQVRYEAGHIIAPGQKASFQELAVILHESGLPIIGNGTAGKANQAGAFATHCVDVEVDPETGKVQILRYTAAQDVGTAIHPSYVEGQIQGGAAQGIGWALNEEYWYDDKGAMRNATYLDYRMPTCYDVPMIEAILVEVPDPSHPYGVRGVGEVPICPPPAAIANAIADAVGIRMTELPMSPHKVLSKILDSTN